MLDSEKEKLFNKDCEYISLGITHDGAPKEIICVPWEKTAHAYNMKIPDVYISPEDLADSQVMDKLACYKLIGCYVWVSLTDYGFLSRFPYIRDLNIIYGDAIEDLDFLYDLKECSMFFLKNAKIKNLDVILDVKATNKNSIFGGFRCVGLYNCLVEDLSRFEKEKHSFSEFLIWNTKQKNEREKWKVVSASTWRYYEIENE